MTTEEMNKIILKDDICSDEITKLLQEKGFTLHQDIMTMSLNKKEPYKSYVQFNKEVVTHSLAIKWLLKEFGVLIVLCPFCDAGKIYKWSADICMLKDGQIDFYIFEPKLAKTPEKANEIAILHTLKNLI